MTEWTDERITLLKSRFREGDTASQIALRLGGPFSRNAVIGKIHRLGLNRGKPSLAPRSVKKTPGAAWQGRARNKPSLATVSGIVVRREVAPPDVVIAPEPEPEIVEPTGRGVRIRALDAAFRMCRWIVRPDKQRSGRDLYCGEPTVAGCSWCAWHRSAATSQRQDVATRKQDGPSRADRNFGVAL